ncbi:outer membrane protein assembly factor BamB family protein [Natronorubrum halophilum]|uniref:outer membrane protein assembly factor BamB family protein n=1 Tax=Natronorubrum halophilum TaxID=1702106 RepID=UPI000EF6F880|nr:PQQ-binding-like beta-propeller repeat protein [Natronorubrum halophilum]
MTDDRLTRRRLLAATGPGLAAVVAGCGYQPGSGEIDWHEERTTSTGLSRSNDEIWLGDGRTLFHVRNRSGTSIEHDGDFGFASVDDARVTAYDSSGQVVWGLSAETQYAGDPAVAHGAAYLSLENGHVTALEKPTGDDDPEPRWTTDWGGPALSLRAGSELVVGVHDDGLVCFDADDGEERFTLEREAVGADELIDAGVADGWVWLTTAGGPSADGNVAEFTLQSITGDGSVRSMTALQGSPDWLETSGTNAVVGVDGTVSARTPAGDRRFSLALEAGTGNGTPILVDESARLYHDSRGALEAINIADGEVAWRRNDYSFRGTPVADADGIYGQGSGPDMNECGLVAVTGAGDPWWGVSSLAALDCSGDLYLVDDRLVVVTDDGMYGFRAEPGRRWTVL